MFDQSTFNPKEVDKLMEKASPKMEALFRKIEEIDAADKKRDGTVYKHMIYTDIRQAQYGVKILAAGFAAKGYKHLYTPTFELKPEKELQKQHNFATLCSTTIYGKPMPVRFRKKILEMFNARPDNIHGENVRFIILDKGFKEGIDLFDIKYIHLFDPLVSTSDEKQAIGRGTRFCGQSGLRFDPKRGWQLHVYRYDVAIPEDLQETYAAGRMFDLYLKNSGIDLRRLIFANTLEKITMEGAVDYPLTRNIHSFGDPTESPSSGLSAYRSLFDIKPLKPRRPSGDRPADVFDRSKVGKLSKWDRFKGPLFDAPVKKLKKSGGKAKQIKPQRPIAPRKKMSHERMKEYIMQRFGRFEWPPIKLENKCVTNGGAASIVEFTPTQEFVRNYFNPSSIYKGLLLYHGTGVGKTCSAMAIASTTFERKGYTILWVTRHTLKADIWKNMFQQVCSLVIQDRIKKGETIPEDAIHYPKKYLSNAWIEPISYKQFSNLLEGKNDLYHKMVDRNGKDDPLRKTLVILDEAHKLYAPDLLPSERPNVNTLRERIHHSYRHSKADSCKVLLMTATPFNTDPMEMIALLNLLRPADEAMPVEYEKFESKYLDASTGLFTPAGRTKYLDDISGYVSYLNREKDARQFAIPELHSVVVSMSRSHVNDLKVELSDKEKAFDQVVEDIDEGTDALKKVKAKIKEDLAKRLKECDDAPRGTKKHCQEEIRADMRKFQETLTTELKEKLDQAKARKQELQKEKRALTKRIKDTKSDLSQEGSLQHRCYGKK